MTQETHVLESLPAYAIGSLDPDEAQQVAEHLAACTLCRQDLEAYQSVADELALAFADSTETPSPQIKQRLMAQVSDRRETSPVRQRWSLSRWMPAAGALALVMIALLAISNVLLWQRMQNMEMLRGPRGMWAIAIQGTDAAPQASAFMIVGADGKNGVFVVDEMPRLAEGQEYQLWLWRNGEVHSGGVFDVDEDGYRGLRVEAPDSLLSYSSCNVTIEPAGGSEYPTGEEVLAGTLFSH
jgi:anti-sigma-K factor RskA